MLLKITLHTIRSLVDYLHNPHDKLKIQYVPRPALFCVDAALFCLEHPMNNKNVGVIGLGAIGSGLAESALALGMSVIRLRPCAHR